LGLLAAARWQQQLAPTALQYPTHFALPELVVGSVCFFCVAKGQRWLVWWRMGGLVGGFAARGLLVLPAAW